MPVIIPKDLPARNTLIQEDPGLVIDPEQAEGKPALDIAILNLMPQKITTEVQLLRVLGKSHYHVSITLMRMGSHQPKNTPIEYLQTFYKTFSEVENQTYDGLIITGAPVETLEFEQVDYWSELTDVLRWRKENVWSTYHICWAVQAAVYFEFGIPKYQLPAKVFGVFSHTKNEIKDGLLAGIHDQFLMPHSRHTEIHRDDIEQIPELHVVSVSEEAGVFLITSTDERQIYVTGHPEYDPYTLRNEYERDVRKGLKIDLPKNYYENDNPLNPPLFQWRDTGPLLYANWLEKIVSKSMIKSR